MRNLLEIAHKLSALSCLLKKMGMQGENDMTDEKVFPMRDAEDRPEALEDLLMESMKGKLESKMESATEDKDVEEEKEKTLMPNPKGKKNRKEQLMLIILGK